MTKQIGRNMWHKYREFITFFSDVFFRTQKFSLLVQQNRITIQKFTWQFLLYLYLVFHILSVFFSTCCTWLSCHGQGF